jgi:hypothetical protein
MSKAKGIYLIAHYFKKPKDGVKTNVKGWMDNPDNIRYDEKVEIARGLRPKDVNAQVVIDLGEKTIVRNSFNDNRDFDAIFQYFFENYSQYVTTVMGQIDPAYLEQVVAKLEGELAAFDQLEADVIKDAEINEEAKAE